MFRRAVMVGLIRVLDAAEVLACLRLLVCFETEI